MFGKWQSEYGHSFVDLMLLPQRHQNQRHFEMQRVPDYEVSRGRKQIMHGEVDLRLLSSLINVLQ